MQTRVAAAEAARAEAARSLADMGPAVLTEREDLSPGLAIFRFVPEAGVPDFEPGQFVPLGLPGAAGGLLWRPYSISSPPGEKRYLELYVRLVREPPEREHFTPLLWELAPGDAVRWKRPRGRFAVVEKYPDGAPDTRRLLFVAGGTGIAPFVSIVLERRARGDRRPIVLCHGARNPAEHGYREKLRALERESSAEEGWDFRYLPTVSRPNDPASASWDGAVGRVETLLARTPDGGPSAVERLLGEPLDPRGTCAYVCGFGGTVRAAKAALEPLGFQDAKRARSGGTCDLYSESYG